LFMDITYSDQILPVYWMRVHFHREIMYVFHGPQGFCTTGVVEQRQLHGFSTPPCLGLEMVAFYPC
jgi:hypothetical protein